MKRKTNFIQENNSNGRFPGKSTENVSIDLPTFRENQINRTKLERNISQFG